MARSTNLSAKQKYERQKELARNRQRKRTENKTEEEKEAKKKYDRERMAKLREEKKIKRINNMAPREKRKMRKYWRERHRAQKKKKEAIANVVQDTPPSSPIVVTNESVQRKRGRKQVRKDKAKVYRTVETQNNRIKELEKKLEKYKKRLQREKKKSKTLCSPSPGKKVREIVGREKVSPQIKKQLFLGLALKKQIDCQIKKVHKTKKNMQIVRKAIGTDILKKYRVQKYFKNLIQGNAKLNHSTFTYERQSKKSITHKLSDKLIKFFEDDRISRMLPGKKDVIKKGPMKKQRRVLLDTVHNLHKQFQLENKVKISRSTFFRSRPFWVTFPKMSDRDTCACIKHSNMDMLVSSLKNTNIIQQRSAKEVLKSVACSIDNEDCMVGRCKTCKSKAIDVNYSDDFNVKFFKWKTITEERLIKNKSKMIKKTVKSVERMRVSQVKNYLKKEVDCFKKHVFYDRHQQSVLKSTVDDLKSGTLVFRIDFSENYVAKFATEVQSIHFGASKKQISLNTGVRYALLDDSVQTVSFASASDNLDHQAHAVWAHLKPILDLSAKEFPDTHTVHIFSDGPSSQYRNRINMYLFKSMIPQYFLKLTTVTWNFSEAGHGKGPMDGVGGTLKRSADQKVLHGTDITCATDFVAAVKEHKILIFEVPSGDIERLKTVVADLSIPPIKGIMQVHQVTWPLCGPLNTRTLSCFNCLPGAKCKHYHLSQVNLDCEIPSLEAKHSKPGPSNVAPKRAKLCVDDVYTSSEDEDEPTPDGPPASSSEIDLLTKFAGSNVDGPVLRDELASGAYVVVEYMLKKGKNSEPKQFIGICQSPVNNEEIDVLFMKNCSKENSLFYVDDKDLASVPVFQIKAILPTPTINLKGNRVFYKFKQMA